MQFEMHTNYILSHILDYLNKTKQNKKGYHEIVKECKKQKLQQQNLYYNKKNLFCFDNVELSGGKIDKRSWK